MMTFLPYPDYEESARVLHPSKHLANQVFEGSICLRAGLGLTKGWQNHPITKMWKPYAGSLFYYIKAVNDVFFELRGRDHKSWVDAAPLTYYFTLESFVDPPWLGDPDFHAAMRSNLLRKFPDWYGQFGWTEPDNLPYIYPTGG